MTKDVVNTSLNFAPGYLFTQVALLVINYALKELPWWVTWFPSLFYGGILALALVILILVAIAAWLSG